MGWERIDYSRERLAIRASVSAFRESYGCPDCVIQMPRAFLYAPASSGAGELRGESLP